MESLWHNAQVLQKKFCKLFAHFSFYYFHIRLLKILQIFLHIRNETFKCLSRHVNFIFFSTFFFANIFYYTTGFFKINFNLWKFAAFQWCILVIFVHQTCDLEGVWGGEIEPPPSISWFSSILAGIGLKLFLICFPKITKMNFQNHKKSFKMSNL